MTEVCADLRRQPLAPLTGSDDALRKRIAILEEENRQLRALLRPRIVLPRSWGLTNQQGALLSAVRAAAPGVLTWHRAYGALRGVEDGAALDTIRNSIAYQIRRRLKAADVPVRLETVWGVGLILSPESVAAFDRLTGRVA